MRLLKKYGLKGYGLYFAIVEIVAFNLETDKPMPDLEENAKDMADFFGEDTVEIEKIIRDCIDLGLFEHSEKTGRVTCLKLLAHLDNTMSSNPEIKNILANFKKLQETSSKPQKLEADKIRLDKSITNNKKEFEILSCKIPKERKGNDTQKKWCRALGALSCPDRDFKQCMEWFNHFQGLMKITLVDKQFGTPQYYGAWANQLQQWMQKDPGGFHDSHRKWRNNLKGV